MRRSLAIALLFALILPAGQVLAGQFETITFPSLDGLEITADLYAPRADRATPLIVLFHQAGWSRGEYRELAPWLNQNGFNCLAIDQRSGHEVNDTPNATAARAKAAGKGTTYIDAQQDLVAALAYARANLATGPVIAWGSSYSAGLVLVVAGTQPELVDAVLSFSPGEYFSDLGRPDNWVTNTAAGIKAPVFVTSARSERENWQGIYAAIRSAKASFVPNTKGNHGSRALWAKFVDSAGYRQAVETFLKRFTGPGPGK